MKTKKQKELIKSHLSPFESRIQLLYQDIILYLSELGYRPKKAGSSISFTNDVHGKQIAKIGTDINKNEAHAPWFSLRFSACKGYSQRFADIVRDAIIKVTANNQYRLARCTTGECNGCKGESGSHIYTSILPNGERLASCGAYAIKIPNISIDDLNEIKELIKEEHEYLVKHESKFNISHWAIKNLAFL